MKNGWEREANVEQAAAKKALIGQIISMRERGMTLRAISERTGASLGSVDHVLRYRCITRRISKTDPAIGYDTSEADLTDARVNGCDAHLIDLEATGRASYPTMAIASDGMSYRYQRPHGSMSLTGSQALMCAQS